MNSSRQTQQPAPFLQGRARVIGTLMLSVATFMNVLDTSIANVSLPTIAGDLGVSPSQGTWVITSFAIANAISLPLTGWLTRRIGQVRLFVSSVLLFVISSWLCGMANSMTMLIAFRVLQGFVAGPMIPLSQTLLLSSYPPEKTGLALATWTMTILVAPMMGPLLGGWISDHLSWPWIFFINVPIGLAAAVGVWLIYRRRETPTQRHPIDVVGLVLLVLWVGALQLMLDKGRELDWFHSPLIVALAVIVVVALAFFLAWELTAKHPVVDLSLFARRNFWSGTLAIAIGYGIFFGTMVLLPLWLQRFMAYTATQSGMVMATIGIFSILLSPAIGLSVYKIDARLYASLSLLIFAQVMWLRSHFTVQTDFVTILLPTLLQGAGIAMFFIPLMTITLSGLPSEHIAAGSGLTNFVRITAGAVGTSIITTVWEDRANLHHAQLAEAVHSGNFAAQQLLTQANHAGYQPQQALALIDRLLTQQAYTLSAADVYYLCTLLLLAVIALVWVARPIQRPPARPASAAAKP